MVPIIVPWFSFIISLSEKITPFTKIFHLLKCIAFRAINCVPQKSTAISLHCQSHLLCSKVTPNFCNFLSFSSDNSFYHCFSGLYEHFAWKLRCDYQSFQWHRFERIWWSHANTFNEWVISYLSSDSWKNCPLSHIALTDSVVSKHLIIIYDVLSFIKKLFWVK